MAKRSAKSPVKSRAKQPAARTSTARKSAARKATPAKTAPKLASKAATRAPARKSSQKPSSKPKAKKVTHSASTPIPQPPGPPAHHIVAISAAVIALLGPLALVRSVSLVTPAPSRWVPHLKRPILRSEHEPRRRDLLSRRPPR